MGNYLVFDWGGTSVKYATGSEAGSFSSVDTFSTPSEGLEALLFNMENIYRVQKKANPIDGIAISSPGAVNPESGVVGGISAIPYIHNIPIRDIISQRFDSVPVSIENDANCAALGELWKGGARGKKNVVVIVSGTGIGGGVIMDGGIYRGSTDNGGEFGNFFIKRDKEGCRTWSSYTMVKQAEAYEKETGVCVDGKRLLELAKTDDVVAKVLIEEFFEAMAVGCYQIQFVLDTELVLLGGGISDGDFLVEEIGKQFDRLEKHNDISFIRPKIEVCHFGSKANLYGALYHHLNCKKMGD